MNPSSPSPRSGLSVRHSLLATARPVSRKWKQFLSILKGKKYQPQHHNTNFDEATAPAGIRRRHSSDELKRQYEFPYYSSTSTGDEQSDAGSSSLPPQSPLPLSSSSPTPAGPVSSALSPPPRRTMMGNRRSCLPPPAPPSREDIRHSRPIIQATALNNLRLSIDIEQHQHRNSSGICASPTTTTISTSSGDDSVAAMSRPVTPFRSGTLGGGYSSHHASYTPPPPVPDLPTPPTTTADITSSSTVTSFTARMTPPPPPLLKERRKRRSPMSIPDDLTLDLHAASSMISAAGPSSTEAEREKAMLALEGKIAATSLEQDKAQYDAVVSGSSGSNSSSATLNRRRNRPGEESPPYSSSSQSTRAILTPTPYYPSTPSSGITVIGLRDEGNDKRPISTIDEHSLNLYTA